MSNDKQLTASEILYSNVSDDSGSPEWNEEEIVNAMEEYATQQTAAKDEEIVLLSNANEQKDARIVELEREKDQVLELLKDIWRSGYFSLSLLNRIETVIKIKKS